MNRPEFGPGSLTVIPDRPRAHVWVNDGVPTLTIISNAPESLSLNWPEENGPVLIFDTSFDVTVTEFRP